MKRLLNRTGLKGFLFLLFTLAPGIAKTQEISPYLIGSNAWYDGAGLGNLWAKMEAAGFQSIRIGGNAAEGYGLNYAKYNGLIDGIRKAGAEPIVQVPRSFTAQQTIDLITNINITNGKKVKLWSIGNEPDMTNNNSTVAVVSAYTKRIGSALKSVDSTIITMGPETSWFQNSAYMSPLIGGAYDITGKDESGHYYIDVVTFHKYMYTDISGLESDVSTLLTKFNTVNAKRPDGKKLSWGLTEFNSSYDNSKNTSPDQNVWSFHAGQVIAELYGFGMKKSAFAMNEWSMLEGQTERAGTDLSLFDKDLKGRSNYYHTLLLGRNMKKYYLTTSDNKTAVVIIPMGDSTGTAIMILNKDHTSGFNYSLRLDNGTFVNTINPLQIKVNAGKEIEIYGSISKEATQMLVLDTAGVLIRRYTYTAADADVRGEPLVESISDDSVPVVSLTQPNDTVDITLKSSLTLSAEASDNGSVVKVEFTANGALIGTAVSSPYTCIWTPGNSGNFLVSARAYDEKGGVGFSTGQIVNVSKVYNYLPVPGTIQAESFDEMSGIQLETTTDAGAGQNVGYCDPGDWLDYTINVQTAGQYLVELRVASLNKTGALSLKSGTAQLASFALPSGTGGWQIWTTVSKIVTLDEGNQVIRLEVTGKEININWLKFTFLPVSVNDLHENKIDVYPNPCFGDNATLFLNGLPGKDAVGIEIYNISGQKVFAAENLLNKSGTVEIQFGEGMKFLAGTYFVLVKSSADNYLEKLIILR
jgi:hypothetical protein